MTMFWFRGSVNSAIIKSKNEKKMFVVFINGNDDISRKMESLYESLSAKLSELPIVAIKLESQSDNCKLFSQIYPVILIPSTYFIDYNGVAIEIIGGSVEDKDVLFDKINKTIEVYKQSLPTNASENVNELTETANTTNTATNEVINATTSGTQSVSDPTPETTNDSQTPGVEEKVKRANQLIEAIREKKAKEETQREKTEEIERRKGLKEMQNSKRMREEKEALDIIKEREREKREEKVARERVLAQIAADREERKKRKMDLTDNKKTDETIVDKREDTQEVRQRVISDKTRIQFRLPDGSTANSIFESKDKLETVREYVSSHFNLRSFILSTTFPRKEFAAEEYCKTLEELSLCPSSALLVIYKTGSNISGAITSPTFFWQIVTYLSLPFVMIWNLMTSFFNRSNRMNSNENNERQEEDDRRKRDPKAFYKDGNVARMRDRMADDDDDDNNTWNGNSTQQM